MRDEEHRFTRTELLLGDSAIDRLRAARVAVFGLGAVGSYAVEGLARAGVGELRLLDYDVVQPSNVNRQLYALESTLGRPKAEVAAERVADINPACRVLARQVRVDAHGAADLLGSDLDVVVDAIDSLPAKIALLAAAVRAGIGVIVSSMGAATRLDPTALRVADLADTKSCPVARKVRKTLRQEGITSGIRCVYSIEPARSFAPEPAVRKPGEPDRERAPLGSLSCVTGVFGLWVALEVIKAVTALPELGRSSPPAGTGAARG